MIFRFLLYAPLAWLLAARETQGVPLSPLVSASKSEPDSLAEWNAFIFIDPFKKQSELVTGLGSIQKRYAGTVNFHSLDATASEFDMRDLHLASRAWPAFGIKHSVKNLRFPLPYETPLNVEAIHRFTRSVLSGAVHPTIKSEPLPDEPHSNGVTIVVGDTYDDIVLDRSKDVLLQYYNPACGPCQTLAPEWERLAQMFSEHNNSVTIAKVDETANDVAQEIILYPTTHLFRADNKAQPILYDGEYVMEDLAAFVRDEGTFHIDVLQGKERDIAQASFSDRSPDDLMPDLPSLGHNNEL